MSRGDGQKQRVYQAEFAVRRVLTDGTFSTPEDVQGYVTAVQDSRWYRAIWPNADRLRVFGKLEASSAHYEWGGSISVPTAKRGGSWALRELVVLHEIAHHHGICHGPEFTGSFLILLAKAVSPEAARLLHAEYVARNVQITYPIDTALALRVLGLDQEVNA